MPSGRETLRIAQGVALTGRTNNADINKNAERHIKSDIFEFNSLLPFGNKINPQNEDLRLSRSIF
jgi:hypothetical protein